MRKYFYPHGSEITPDEPGAGEVCAATPGCEHPVLVLGQQQPLEGGVGRAPQRGGEGVAAAVVATVLRPRLSDRSYHILRTV